MNERVVQLIARYIGVAMTGVTTWLGLEYDAGEVDSLAVPFASAVVAIVAFIIDKAIHRLGTGGVMKPAGTPKPPLAAGSYTASKRSAGGGFIFSVALIIFAPAIVLVGGCAGRSTADMPGGGKYSSLGAPPNVFSETHEDGTVETAMGPVVTSRTRVDNDEYVTHGPGQASSIIIKLRIPLADGSVEEVPIEFDVQTVANWKAEQITYNPTTGGFDVRGMEVSASAILDAANAIYPELARMVEAGALTEQQAWQLISAVMMQAIETAGEVVNPASGLDEIGDVLRDGE